MRTTIGRGVHVAAALAMAAAPVIVVSAASAASRPAFPTPLPTITVPAAVPAAPVGSVQASVRLGGNNPGAWFGGPAHRTLELTVTNPGPGTLAAVPVTLTAGRGSNPQGVIQRVRIGPIAAGATTRYTVPVSFRAPAIGTYTAQAVFDDPGAAAIRPNASSSSYPWVLFLLGWLLLQPLLLGLYNRRPSATKIEPEWLDPAEPDPAIAPAALPDLDLTTYEHPIGSEPYPVQQVHAAPVPSAIEYIQPVADAVPVAPPDHRRPIFGVDDMRAYLDQVGSPPAVEEI